MGEMVVFGPIGLGFLIGAALAGMAVFAFFGRKSAGSDEAIRRLEHECDELKGRLELVAQSERQVVELQTRLEEQQKHAVALQERMAETFAKISQETVDTNSKAFLELAATKFEPFKELLNKTQVSVQDLESKRVEAYVKLQEAAKLIVSSNAELRSETSKLETALRRPDHRGKWGEVGLRNVVEFAGMVEHCDFEEQVVGEGDQRLRPDMVINMPGSGHIVVDSKLPLEHYLNAIDEPDKSGEHLQQHALCVEQHVKSLAGKEYWIQFEHTPSFVVMFVNVESALVAALERKPELHEYALERKVLLTSPATLVALLQAAAYGWRHDSMAKNAEEIAKAGQELFDRLSNFRDHLNAVGKRLHQATESYNSAVGSFTTRLEPGAKRLSELQATGGKELPPTEPIDLEPRSLESSSSG
jgi:DNA recombination protein RmuC